MEFKALGLLPVGSVSPAGFDVLSMCAGGGVGVGAEK